MRGKMADDLAGVAGGAFSALAGLRREMGELVRSGTDEMAQRLALASREEVEVLREMAAGLAAGNAALMARVEALEARLAALETAAEPAPPGSEPAQPGAEPAPPAEEQEDDDAQQE